MSGSDDHAAIFRIPGASTESLEVEIRGYGVVAPPEADANTLDAEVRLDAGEVQGRYGASFRVEDLERFWQEVEVLYDRLAGEARLESLERRLELRVTADALGHLTAVGTGGDPANILRFTLRFDQTQLFGVKVQLAEILNRYAPRDGGAAL